MECSNRIPLSSLCDLEIRDIQDLLEDALAITDHSIAANRRDDGLYHAYNVAEFGGDTLRIHNLYAMLEGQVAALSSGAIGADEAADLGSVLHQVPALVGQLHLYEHVAGQMAGALALDHFGALGFPERPVTLLRLAGVACVVVGLVLLSRE